MNKMATNNTSDTIHQHFKMYKPAGVLSQFVFNHRKRRNRRLLGDVVQSSDLALPAGIMAIGRLDEDSEGLLLLTTDGKMSKRVREKDVEKEYWVQVRGRVTDAAIDKLRKGVKINLPSSESGGNKKIELDGHCNNVYQTLPSKVQLLDTEVIEVEMAKRTIHRSSKKADNNPAKKFKGACNKCGVAGHKTKECSLNQSLMKRNEATIKMALPSAIPPSKLISLAEDAKHGPTTWMSITITDGKNRQVRRMTAAVGHPVLRLVRVRIGSVALDGMKEGDLRNLPQAEMDSFVTKSNAS